jgi:Ni,Fe-hydrogenase III large subunit/Ni,Fe-hydrogenase III component G
MTINISTALNSAILPNASSLKELAPDKSGVPVNEYQVESQRFDEIAGILKKAGGRLAAEWVADETPLGGGFGVYACYARADEYVVVKTVVPVEKPVFPSLTKYFIPAYRFERQMRSLFGVVPKGHPDMRPWILHEDWPADQHPLRKSFDINARPPRENVDYPWSRVDGEAVFEIPVGPVHAGIIEPGHFRFQSVGEDILNLEVRLGYVHKGVEKRFETMSLRDGVKLAARISGDSTVAHSLAYCMALESMTGCRPSAKSLWIRALLLERERIANHLGDLGALANDAAFTFLFYHFTRIKELLLRANMRLFGHRFMMDVIIPGGVTKDIGQRECGIILSELAELKKEFERLMVIYEENPSFQERIFKTGVLEPEMAEALCAVGFAGRASGQRLDCRNDFPFGPYESFTVSAPVLHSGDVHARAWVRVMEIRESMKIIEKIINNLPQGGVTLSSFDNPPAGAEGFSAVEGWRGEIVCWIQAGKDGSINRLMARDPSAVNWLGLEMCIKGDIVPDFPLCNKSFNQSYSGHDL